MPGLESWDSGVFGNVALLQEAIDRFWTVC